MNGAESLLTTLTNNGVNVCFTNPGTSEMHFVAALDEVAEMRCVLCLFEGVLSGAADGYARMTGKPASTLLHLGPGLGNALANIHNAKKGHSPMVNIVGDHATYHLEYDAPLTSDIEAIAGPVSHWVHTSRSPEDIARDGAEAVRQAGFSQIATLMLPADVSWSDNPNGAEAAVQIVGPLAVPAERIDDAAARLSSGANTLLLLGGREVSKEHGLLADQIAQATGARVLIEVLPGKVARGEGTATIERLAYLAELAIDSLKDVEQLILVGATDPVSFFAYPGVPSAIAPDAAERFVLAGPNDDIDGALTALAGAVGGTAIEPRVHALDLPDLAQGELDAGMVGMAIAHHLPEDAILVDEGITSGMMVNMFTGAARRHTQLNQTGGSIGWGLPAALGASIACPDRKVVCIEGDGSAMYTIQALWSMARENADVTIVIFNNRKYSILEMEYGRTGARDGVPGPSAASTLDIGNPDMDFVAMAQGMGVQAARATTAEEFNALFSEAMSQQGPRLIDAIVPTVF
ncbi:acetolactate synthase large subunit [Halioglobus maricola]|uniref:Acetolactate synthase large subunit n=1 Tax=Halioglobus maricola TaxID=2601894 RepID=A0A5P9NIF3_9GAMM|nr:acetolactate synthase large subunit [Halioglobus maricola]QFU75306.1 acetolactate synthase large subunit [Halioglobus maricola]